MIFDSKFDVFSCSEAVKNRSISSALNDKKPEGICTRSKVDLVGMHFFGSPVMVLVSLAMTKIVERYQCIDPKTF